MEVVEYPTRDPDTLARRTRGRGIRTLRRTELWRVLRHCGVEFNERRDNWERLIERAEDAGITNQQAAEALTPKPPPPQQIGRKAHAAVDIDKAPQPVLRGLCKEAGHPMPKTATRAECLAVLRGEQAD